MVERFNLPVINKDEIKELLFDSIGVNDKEWALKLGMTSFQLTFFFLEKLLQTGKPFIVEGNFDNRYSTKSFLDIELRFHHQTIQLFCHAQDEILYERYISRDKSGNRHSGHIRLTTGFEEYQKGINSKTFKLAVAPYHLRSISYLFLTRFLKWNQPINPCYIIFILLAKGLRELLLFFADENHNTDIQKDRSHKIDPG